MRFASVLRRPRTAVPVVFLTGVAVGGAAIVAGAGAGTALRLALLFPGAAVLLSRLALRHTNAIRAWKLVEERWRLTAELVPDAVLIHSYGVITYANSAAALLFGAARPAALVGRSILDLVPLDDARSVEAVVLPWGRSSSESSSRAADAPGGTVESRAKALDGREMRVAVRATRLPEDNSIVVTYREIGWWPDGRAEEQHSTEMMRALIRSSPVAIVAVTPDRVVTTWSPAAERTFGWPAGAVIGRPYPLSDIDTDPMFAASLVAAAEGRATTYHAKRRHRDGRTIDVIVSTAPVRDRSGRLERIFALLVDVTEQQRLELEFRQAQKMEAIGRLAGGVAHDFNNLLTAILGFAEIALIDLPDGSPGRTDIEEIHRAGARAATLTRQLLTFSRKQLLQPVVVDVNEQLEADERFLARVIGEDVRVVLRLSANPVFVLADPSQLDQVIMNLAVNARDAMPEGGVLEITVDRVASDDRSFRRRVDVQPGEYVRIAVRDSGIGMPPEVRQRLFEPFFTTKAPGKGTGLGLATVFGIVKQSGGSIWVDSEPGCGTTVTVCLPAACPPAEARDMLDCTMPADAGLTTGETGFDQKLA